MGTSKAAEVKIYDFIIAGGGVAGLSLAYQIAQSPLRGKSILIVDRAAKDLNDRSFCFWTASRTPLDHLMYHTWDRVEVIGARARNVYDIRPYQYALIRGIDFYQGMQDTLGNVPGIEFRKGRVTEISDSKDTGIAQVMIDDIPYGARYAFDSTISLSEMRQQIGRHPLLLRHFKSWVIQTPDDAFDPQVATLFDFRTPKKDCFSLFQVLPFTRRRAAVEYTLFSPQTLKPHEYDRAIADHLENTLRVPKYRIESIETGTIPLTSKPFPRRLKERAISIGTKGGCVKPSFGNTFQRIQKDTSEIIASLINTGDPFHISVVPSSVHRWLDSLILEAFTHQGDRMEAFLTRYIEIHSPQTLFRVLDEESSLSQDASMISTLLNVISIQSFIKQTLLHKA